MAWINRIANRMTVGLALLGTLGIVAMMLHVTLDVVLRTTLSVSIPATLEIVTRYYMITLALLPLGWVEHQRSMISVEALSALFGTLGKRLIDVLVALLSAAIYFIFTVATWEKAVDQFDQGSYVMSLDFPMPVWPTYFVLPVSFGLAMLVCLVRIPRLLTQTTPDSDAA